MWRSEFSGGCYQDVGTEACGRHGGGGAGAWRNLDKLTRAMLVLISHKNSSQLLQQPDYHLSF